MAPLKQYQKLANCYCEKLSDVFNKCLQENKFPVLMKKVEIISVFEKLDNTSKENSRPISNLSSFTKIFKGILLVQLNNFTENKCSEYLTGFWKKQNTQHFLLTMIESQKGQLFNDTKVGAIIMDLQKAFNSLCHYILLAKNLTFMDTATIQLSFPVSCDYVSNRYQRCKMNYFSVSGKEVQQMLLKALVWDHCFSIFLLMVMFYFFKNERLQITLMVLLCTHLTTI